MQPAAAITLKPVLYVAIPDIENEACDHRFVLDRAYLGELIDGLCLARDHRDMTE
ncbi:MAG TPA: hypothetical protein VFF65_02840 [Phycisphaerales bacterium]|nr:hypothetical protein [Phycisphaerales bacterium]